jgi:hypothetical protein
MTKPDCSEQSIVTFLVKEQLPRMSQTRIDLAVFIDIGSDHPGAGGVVGVEYSAFSDVDEEPNVLLAPKMFVNFVISCSNGEGVYFN